MGDFQLLLPIVVGMDKKKFEILAEKPEGVALDDPYCDTYALYDEDHTLSNALRIVMMKNPNVKFCGYSIPHPLESRVLFRVETFNKVPAIDAFKKGLEDLHSMCGIVLEKFEAAVGDHAANIKS